MGPSLVASLVTSSSASTIHQVRTVHRDDMMYTLYDVDAMRWGGVIAMR